RRRAPLRARQPGPQDDPLEDRAAAVLLMEAAPEEACRPAVDTDVPRLVELAESAVAELSAGRGGLVWARTRPRRAPYGPGFDAALADPGAHVVVGTLDGTVMGYGAVRVEVLE